MVDPPFGGFSSPGDRATLSHPHLPRSRYPDQTASDEGARKEAKMMMLEKLLDIEVSEHGTVTEEIELICTMTGFRRRFLVHHIGEGFFRSVDLGPS
jgi:hypothetical protein